MIKVLVLIVMHLLAFSLSRRCLEKFEREDPPEKDPKKKTLEGEKVIIYIQGMQCVSCVGRI